MIIFAAVFVIDILIYYCFLEIRIKLIKHTNFVMQLSKHIHINAIDLVITHYEGRTTSILPLGGVSAS